MTTPRTNLPAAAYELVGRAEAVRNQQDLLSAYRVVTLTGPGGIGKTALGLEVVRRAMGEFDGAWLVELAALTNAELVPAAVAQVLGLGLGGDPMSAEAVARSIGGRWLFC